MHKGVAEFGDHASAGEEGLGRYLDLHPHFLAFLNTKFGKKGLEYFEYVTGLGSHLTAVPRSHKMTVAFRWGSWQLL